MFCLLESLARFLELIDKVKASTVTEAEAAARELEADGIDATEATPPIGSTLPRAFCVISWLIRVAWG